MQFLVTAYDGENMLDKRMEVRPRHLENMARLGKKVVVAGGFLDEEGKMKGSALVLDLASKEELDKYLASEPYIVEKVWERVEVETLNVVLVKGDKYQ